MYRYLKIWQPVYEGDGGGDEPKTYTQEQVDEMLKGRLEQKQVDKLVEERLARDRQAREKKNEGLIRELESLRELKGTSEEQRKALEARIEDLRAETQTKEQTLQKEMAKTAKKHQKELEELATERDHWQQQFSQQMIQTSIRAAATEHGALPQAHTQLVAILGSMNARVAEVLAEGQATGQYEPVVTFNDVDENGKPVLLEKVAISDAVKRMKELPDQYGNLFSTNASGGMGGNTTGGGAGASGQPNFAEMGMTEYRKRRREGTGPAARS